MCIKSFERVDCDWVKVDNYYINMRKEWFVKDVKFRDVGPSEVPEYIVEFAKILNKKWRTNNENIKF